MKRNNTAKLLLGLAAFGSLVTSTTQAEEKEVGFLLVGDSGYHLDYLKPKDYYKRAKTEQQGRADSFERWARKYESFETFKFPQFTYVPDVGGFVQSSGLYTTAAGMMSWCERNACDFAVMLGDNIYDAGATLGKDGRDDKARFRDMFTRPFGRLGDDVKDFQIYVTLGNHDWGTSREGAMAQVEFLENDPKFYMDGLFYTVKPPAANGDVELFIVDTEILKSTYPNYKMKLNKDGTDTLTNKLRNHKKHTHPINNAEKNQLSWLTQKLKNSTAKWKFIVAHHPLWSSSGAKSQDNYIMREHLLPIACEYADGYFAGHDHTLEIVNDSCQTVIKDKNVPPLLHIVSGAAAKLRPIDQKYIRGQNKQYPSRQHIWAEGMEWGFGYMSVKGDKAKVKMLTLPYSGPKEMKVAFEYELERRSNWRSK